MHTPKPLEYCFVCEEPTGKAGISDGSLYCECDKGPFCDECWDNHHNADTKVADLLEALEDLVEAEDHVPWDDYSEQAHYHNIKAAVIRAKQAIEKAKE